MWFNISKSNICNIFWRQTIYMYKKSVSVSLNVCTWTNSVWHQLLTFKGEHSLWALVCGQNMINLWRYLSWTNKNVKSQILINYTLTMVSTTHIQEVEQTKKWNIQHQNQMQFFSWKRKKEKKLINPLNPVKLRQNDWVKQIFTKMLHSNKTSRAELYMMLLLL